MCFCSLASLVVLRYSGVPRYHDGHGMIPSDLRRRASRNLNYNAHDIESFNYQCHEFSFLRFILNRLLHYIQKTWPFLEPFVSVRLSTGRCSAPNSLSLVLSLSDL
jgi:hypothetical protein